METLDRIDDKKLRVLFVGVAYIIGLYQAKLEAMLHTEQFEIALLCPIMWKFREWSGKFTLENHIQGVRYYPAKVVLFNGFAGGYLYPLRTLLKAINEFKPELIYVEQEVFSLSAFQLACFSRLFHIPLAIFCWENMDRRFSFVRQWTRKVVLSTASLITPGNKDAEALVKKWGYKKETRVLPQLGVDRSIFYPRSRNTRQEFFSMGYVGRLVPEKGVDLILVAASQLIAQGFKCRVIICGIGPTEVSLRRQADDLGLSDFVTWLGEFRYQNVPQAIEQMDVLVLPSRTVPQIWKEQFGHVLIEAMAMAVPVVGSSCGAIPDVIGREDLIFMEDDVEGLMSILRKIIVDTQYAKALEEYGLERVDSQFTHSVIASQLRDLFKRLI